jgi:hypothetical protein
MTGVGCIFAFLLGITIALGTLLILRIRYRT